LKIFKKPTAPGVPKHSAHSAQTQHKKKRKQNFEKKINIHSAHSALLYISTSKKAKFQN
jgi:hypothetical protein